MIKIETLEVSGLLPALHGMRNPRNSWEFADSTKEGVGDADSDLAKRLILSGTEHRKFLRMIQVWANINAPMLWWKQFDAYKIGTVRNSCSTMHTLTAKEFALTDFSTEGMTPAGLEHLQTTVDWLNEERTIYKQTKNEEYWMNILRLLPESYNQKATVMLNYETLRNIRRQRTGHRLHEWAEFITWTHSLPESWMLE